MTTTLESAVRFAWRSWGEYAMHTRCGSCGELGYCRRARRGGRWLCLGCFDLSPEGQR